MRLFPSPLGTEYYTTLLTSNIPFPEYNKDMVYGRPQFMVHLVLGGFESGSNEISSSIEAHCLSFAC